MNTEHEYDGETEVCLSVLSREFIAHECTELDRDIDIALLEKSFNQVEGAEEIMGSLAFSKAESRMPATHQSIAKEALAMQSNAIKSLAERIGTEFHQAVESILACEGRVVVCGMGKSGLVGRKLSATLASTGTHSFFMHPGEALHGDIGMLKPVDVVILISYSGETEEVIRLIPSLKSFGNLIIAMTGNLRSSLARHADLQLDISIEREVCPNNLAPTTSTLAAMAMGDALAVALIKARGFRPADFARCHPAGNLGRRLMMRVSEAMNTVLPVVRPEILLHECLFTMTAGRMGLVLVMKDEELVGIVTDGDLRRALLKDSLAMNMPVGNYMTRSPLTIRSNALVSEAETRMRQNKISALVAVDQVTGRVCGILELFGQADS